MALAFRAILQPRSANDDLVAIVNAWLNRNGLGQLDTEAEVAGESVTASLRSVEDGATSVREVIIHQSGSPTLRSTLIEVADQTGSILLAEEETIDIAGGFAEIPEVSELVREVVSASIVCDYAGSDSSSAFHAAAAAEGPLGLPEVITVGAPEEQSYLRDLLELRVEGMSLISPMALEAAAPRVNQALADGSVVVLEADGSTRAVLPAMVCRLDPTSAARRIHREVLSCIGARPLPDRLRHAQRKIRRATGSVDEWLNEVERLEAELEVASDSKDTAILEATSALSDLDDARRRIKHLERTLRDQYEMFAVIEEEEEPPTISSFDDIFTYASDLLPNLSIRPETRRDALKLDARPEAMIWSQQAWEALMALNEYVQAKHDGAADGNFYTYCSNSPPGWLALPASKVALHESQSTLQNPDMQQMRTFAVPESVDASGYLLMEAHIKVAKAGTDVPRLHFYDDTNGTTKKILVGYLGPHLPTSSS